MQDLIGDGCQSDLDISDEEIEPVPEVLRLLDEDVLQQNSPHSNNEDSDPESNIPLNQLSLGNQENIPPADRTATNRSARPRATRRSRLWRATDFTDKYHDYPTLPTAKEVKSPLQYLEQYFNEDFFENLANCTNLYYLRKTGSVLNTRSQEMRKLFGILLVMGCIPYPRINMYWRAGMRLEIIANQMSRDRFFQLRNNMHVVNSDEPPPGNTNPLWKVQPMLDAVKNACKSIERVPGTYSIDEQIIPFTGKCKFRVLVKNKPRPLGFKNYVITTSNGLMLDFEIYYPNNPALTDRSLGEGPAVILCLSKNVPPGSCLYFDRYFNTIPLLDRLNSMQLHGTGTIMLNRIPDHKKLNLKKDGAMKRGDILQFTSGDVALVKWKDNKGVLMASNCTGGNQTSSITRWDKKQKTYVQVTAPRVILNYNKYMGGVDVLDQLIEYYRTFQKTKKWTVKMLIHFLDLAVVNAWRQYKMDCDANKIKSKDLLWFRVDLADALMNSCNFSNNESTEDELVSLAIEIPGKRYRPAAPPSFEKRFDKFDHFPTFDDLSRGRKCRLESCSSTTKVRCTKCNVYLCILRNQNCFIAYHNK